MAVWDNPDVDLLYDINGLARDAPSWADTTMEFVGEYGIAFGLVAVALWTWWRVVRRRQTRQEAVYGFAGLVWAPLAAVIALLINFPIRELVERPRPFFDHQGLEVVVEGKTDYSFVSDHATLTMAIAVGVLLVNRKYGLVALVLALLEGFCRVYMGVHYPTDVVGGLALGTAVALLLAPLGMWVLTPLVRAVMRVSALSTLIWAGPLTARTGEAPGGEREGRDRDLAA